MVSEYHLTPGRYPSRLHPVFGCETSNCSICHSPKGVPIVIRKVSLSAALSIALLASTAFAGETYTLDKNHSSLGFKVRHMGVSSVRGEFEDFTMEVSFDEADMTKSSVAFTADPASVNTRNENRDDHLRTSDFLDIENHPEISFESSSIRKEGEYFIVTGNLSIRGVTEEVDLKVAVAGPIDDPWGNHRLGIEGSVTIDRQDFGVSYNNLLEAGGLVVANEVTIEFAVEAVRPTG